MDFIPDPTEEHLLVLVGTDGYKSVLKLVNSSDKILKSYLGEEGKFSQVSYIKTPKMKVQGIFAGNDKGAISIFSYPFQD